MPFLPTAISDDVLAFCDRVAPDTPPVYINITPELDCAEGECFWNVKRQTERDAGRIQFGWSIWEWPGVALQAEHHAVYVPPFGQPWRDITPSRSENRRLFLPDDSAIYDFSDYTTRRDNIRFALKDDLLIREFFTAAEHYAAIRKSIPATGTVLVSKDVAKKLAEAEMERDRLVNRIMEKYPSPTVGS